MHAQRLLHLASFLDQLEASRFTMRAWVSLPGSVFPTDLRALPAQSQACPIGWLPAVDPANWCWIHVDCPEHGGIYPVYKQATAWQEVLPQPRGGGLHPVICRLWQQAREWFELDSMAVTVRMFEADAYGGVEPKPVQVAARIREVVTSQ